MTRRRFFLTGFLASLCALGTEEVAGQSVSAAVTAQHLSFGAPAETLVESAQLIITPFVVTVPFRNIALLEVDGGTASATLRFADGLESKLSGPIDTRLSVASGFGPASVRVIAILPTGQETFVLDEAIILGLLGHELLSFAAPRWGSTAAVGGELGLAGRLANTDLAVRAGFSAPAEQSLISGTAPYAPGAAVQLQARADLHGTDADVLTLGVGVVRYEDDLYLGDPNYARGIQIRGSMTYGRPLGARESLGLFVSVAHAAAGQAALRPSTEAGSTPQSLTLSGTTNSPSRGLFTAGMDLRILRGRWTFAPRADLKVFRSGDGLGQGWMASGGLRAERHVLGQRLGRRLVGSAWIRGRLGGLTLTETSTSGLTGAEAGVSASYVLGALR